MQVVLKDNSKFILKFEKGEEVLSLVSKFTGEQKFAAGVFNGIGACSFAELLFYNSETKKYDKKEFSEDLEILSLSGNVALKDGKPVVHAHTVFGKSDFSTIGGHVSKLIISATCEMVFVKFDGEMKRELNQDLNLNLLV